MELASLAEIAPVVAGSVAAIYAAFCKGMAFVDTLLVHRGLEKWHRLHSEMASAVHYGADRIALFGAHNCGGLPRVGNPFFTTALHWHDVGSSGETLAHIRDVGVDQDYVAMCLDLVAKGYVRFDKADGKSLLSKIYKADGITDSLIFYLKVSRKTFYYISFSRRGGEFQDDVIVQFSLIANAVKKLI